MNLVIDAKTLSVHGFEKPLPVSDVEGEAVYFCLERAKPAKDVGVEAGIEIVSAAGSVRLKGCLESIGPGPGAAEFEMVLRFKRPGRRATEALGGLAEAFNSANGFLAPHVSEEPQDPGKISALQELDGGTQAAEIDEVAFSRALAGTLGLPFADLEVTGVDVLRVRDFNRLFLLDGLFLPLGKEGKQVKIAIGRLPTPRLMAALKRTYGENLRFVVALATQIVSSIETAFQVRPNRRRSARIAVALRVRVGLYGEGWSLAAGPVEGTTRNVSTGGVLLVAQPLKERGQPLAPEGVVGKRAGLLIYLPEYTKPLIGAGRFLRAKAIAGPSSMLHSYAVELNYMPEEDRRRLDVFRYTLLWGSRRLKVEE